MQVGMGVLGFSSCEFWSLTMREFFAAWDGWKEANGIKEKGEEESDRIDPSLLPDMEEVRRIETLYGGG